MEGCCSLGASDQADERRRSRSFCPRTTASSHLPQLLESVRAQEHPHVRLSVRDDGSSDGTVGLLEQLVEGQVARPALCWRQPGCCPELHDPFESGQRLYRLRRLMQERLSPHEPVDGDEQNIARHCLPFCTTGTRSSQAAPTTTSPALHNLSAKQASAPTAGADQRFSHLDPYRTEPRYSFTTSSGSPTARTFPRSNKIAR